MEKCTSMFFFLFMQPVPYEMIMLNAVHGLTWVFCYTVTVFWFEPCIDFFVVWILLQWLLWLLLVWIIQIFSYKEGRCGQQFKFWFLVLATLNLCSSTSLQKDKFQSKNYASSYQLFEVNYINHLHLKYSIWVQHFLLDQRIVHDLKITLSEFCPLNCS